MLTNMSVKPTEMLNILKNLYRITVGVIILFILLPVVLVWFTYLFLKFLIEYET